jgi:hypothetical protein
MSFIGRNGFFGAMQPYSGSYHPSVYRKYSRGGGPAGGGYKLGNAFAYKRPAFDDGEARAAGIGVKRRADLIDIRMALKDKRLIKLVGNEEWGVDHEHHA